MKADLIYRCGLFGYGRDQAALLSQNAKWVTIHGRRERIDTSVWGAAEQDLAAEAAAINAAQKALDTRRKALDARLLITQPALLAAAKAAPKDPPPEPFRLDGPLSI